MNELEQIKARAAARRLREYDDEGRAVGVPSGEPDMVQALMGAEADLDRVIAMWESLAAAGDALAEALSASVLATHEDAEKARGERDEARALADKLAEHILGGGEYLEFDLDEWEARSWK